MELNLTDTNQEKAIPTLQANLIPHAIRHGAIHGALGTRQVGESLILVAPHNPVPLLREVEAREEKYELEYIKEEPREYHIKFTRCSSLRYSNSYSSISEEHTSELQSL